MDLKVKLEEINDYTKQLDVEIPAEEVDREFDKFYRELKREVSIPGFRKGKVPLNHLKRLFHKEAKEEVMKHLLEHSLHEVMEETGLQPLSEEFAEEPEEPRPGQPLSYRLSLEVRPPIPLQRYSGFEISVTPAEVPEERIEEELERLRKEAASFEPLAEDRPVEMGDLVVLDFEGTIEGKEEIAQKDYELVVGEDGSYPGLEKKLVGLRKGVPERVEVTLDDEAPGSQGGKRGTFRVEIKDIKARKLPPLDDEFAQDVGAFASLDELRARIREQLEAHEARRKEEETREKVEALLVAENPIEIPPRFLEKTVEQELGKFRQMMAYFSGRLLEEKKEEWENLLVQERSRTEERVRKQIALHFVVEAIAEAEGIEATDEEFEAFVEAKAHASHQPVGQVKAQIEEKGEREEILASIRHRKVLDYVVEHSTVREEKPEEEAPSRIILP